MHDLPAVQLLGGDGRVPRWDLRWLHATRRARGSRAEAIMTDVHDSLLWACVAIFGALMLVLVLADRGTR